MFSGSFQWIVQLFSGSSEVLSLAWWIFTWTVGGIFQVDLVSTFHPTHISFLSHKLNVLNVVQKVQLNIAGANNVGASFQSASLVLSTLGFAQMSTFPTHRMSSCHQQHIPCHNLVYRPLSGPVRNALSFIKA